MDYARSQIHFSPAENQLLKTIEKSSRISFLQNIVWRWPKSEQN